MRIRTLEQELKSLAHKRDKAEEQYTAHLSTAKAKLEKESENVRRLTESLRASESRIKELSSVSTRVSELERRVDELEDRGQGPASSGGSSDGDVQTALVAWGEETKRYVDESVARVGEEQRRLRREELTRVWDRVLEVEARLDGR